MNHRKLSSRRQAEGIRIFFGWMLILVFAASGCGYTRKTTLPQDIKTIYVHTVTNKIPLDTVFLYEPGMEIQITDAIIRRLHRDGNLKVVGSPEDADVVLESSLIRFEQEGLRFTSLESVEEYRMYVVLDMRLKDPKSETLFWEEANFSGDAEYFVSDVRSIARQEAAERAIDRLAVNVVDRIVEDW